jgi:hypothetical protein
VYPTLEAARARFRLVPPENRTAPYILDYVARHSLKEVAGGWTWKFDAELIPKHDDAKATDILAKIKAPVAFIEEMTREHFRTVGLGMMELAEALMAFRDHYGSPCSERYAAATMSAIALAAWEEPLELATAGEERSPLGDVLADAPIARREAGPGTPPAPFHGYYFKILTAQGPAAPGGTMDYLVNGEMTRGFAFVAWPARYDLTGIMTFVINQDGVVYQRDLGPDTDTMVRNITRYDPDEKWWEPVTEPRGSADATPLALADR